MVERISFIGDRGTATSSRVEEVLASASASAAREVSQVSGKAGKAAVAGVAYSHPLRLVPPTPSQSLYPRSQSSCKILTSSDAATSAAAIEDRVESGDRYKGDAFIRHRRQLGVLLAAEGPGQPPDQRPGQRPGKTQTETETGTETKPGRFNNEAFNKRFEQSQYPVGGSLRRFGMRRDDDSSVDLAAFRENTGSLMNWKAREVTRRELDVEERIRGRCIAREQEEREGREPEEGQIQANSRVAQIAAGLLWVQKHPVLAAVMWVCGKVLVPAGEDECEDNVSDGEDEKASQTSPIGASNPNPFKREASSSRDLIHYASGSGKSLDDQEKMKVKGRVSPSALDRRTSKGRLSWSDDFGGCLAEYYEDAILGRQQEDAGLSGGMDAGNTWVSSTGPSNANGCAPHKPEEDFGIMSHTSASPSTPGGVADAKISTLGASHSAGAGTWSPQWGWYVTTTPPQDIYPKHQTSIAATKSASKSEGGNEDVSSRSGCPPKP